MTFEEWLRENDIDEDEYFSISDMRWYAEIAWKAAMLEMVKQEKKAKENTMTLLYSCPKCGYAHDVKLEPNKITPVTCPQCEFEYYIELKLWKQGDRYYGSPDKY